jgi:hypothetical protein
VAQAAQAGGEISSQRFEFNNILRVNFKAATI